MPRMNYDLTVPMDHLLLAVLFPEVKLAREAEAAALSYIRNAMHQHADVTVRTGINVVRELLGGLNQSQPSVDGIYRALSDYLLRLQVWDYPGHLHPAFIRRIQNETGGYQHHASA